MKEEAEARRAQFGARATRRAITRRAIPRRATRRAFSLTAHPSLSSPLRRARRAQAQLKKLQEERAKKDPVIERLSRVAPGRPEEEPKPAPFKATPVPLAVSDTTRWREMQLRDAGRAEKIGIDAQRLQQMASLPPRMAAYANEEQGKRREALQKIKAVAEKDATFTPAITDDVPDFKKKQRQFAAMLEHRKQAARMQIDARKKEVKPFAFRTDARMGQDAATARRSRAEHAQRGEARPAARRALPARAAVAVPLDAPR